MGQISGKGIFYMMIYKHTMELHKLYNWTEVTLFRINAPGEQAEVFIQSSLRKLNEG